MGIKIHVFVDLNKKLFIKGLILSVKLPLFFSFITFDILCVCMTTQDPGRLYNVSTKVNLVVCQEILKHFLVSSSEDLRDDNIEFLQDSASSHTSQLTIKWFQEKNINVLPWLRIHPI